MTHPYRGRIAGLATQHHKLPLVGPAMRETMGLLLIGIDVDTDSLGTFAGERPRSGTPWETAVAKARLGMGRSGLPFGVANEGSISPYGPMPLITSDFELVVFVDDELGITIGETAEELGPPCVAVDVDGESLDMSALLRAGFPEHGVIVRPSGNLDVIVKGVHDERSLRAAVERCVSLSSRSTARIESDFRSHHHPWRRNVIRTAAQRLAQRLATGCPRCSTPGWGVTRREAGARCSWCRHPTRMLASEHWACALCPYTETRTSRHADGADPATCPRCNP